MIDTRKIADVVTVKYDLAFKLWPRACAFAEAVWTAPATPRGFDDFARRMEVHRSRLIAVGVNCAPSACCLQTVE